MKVALASGNRGKLGELADLLAPLGVELVPQAAFGISPAAETAPTFIENALAKARHVATLARCGAIADDSGLVVPALGGRPGIFSARFAGSGSTDQLNNRKLIAELAGVADRRAWFYCALVYLAHAADPAPVVATATWHGRIIDEPRGTHGFGYDPHFYLPDLDKTSAELDAATKNRLSHRGQAARALREHLRQML